MQVNRWNWIRLFSVDHHIAVYVLEGHLKSKFIFSAFFHSVMWLFDDSVYMEVNLVIFSLSPYFRLSTREF